MAGADYYLCDRCDAKVFYDFNVDWPEGITIAALCKECSRDYTVAVMTRDEYDKLLRRRRKEGA